MATLAVSAARIIARFGVAAPTRHFCLSHKHHEEKAPHAMSTTAVRVTFRGDGPWEVVVVPGDTRLAFETLEAARLAAASVCVNHAHPCELIVHDAYHRVVQYKAYRCRDSRAPPADTGIGGRRVQRQRAIRHSAGSAASRTSRTTL
jgi:hypothetical protein